MDYASLTAEAEKAEPFRSLINPNAARFAKPGEMPDNIATYCRETGQPAPETPGQFTRCILESLALSYRAALDEIEELTGRSIARLHIVGGGSQSILLDQFAANATQREVIAGPVEATAAGNVLIQAIALGQVESHQALREIVRDSFPLQTFRPRDAKSWQEAYHRSSQLELHNVTMNYKFVNYLWDDAVASKLDPVDRLVYRSNLLGSDQRITNTGGGNTSSKLMEHDPLTGEEVEVLWVKGSGGDLRTAKRENFSSLYQQKLLDLQKLYAQRSDKGVKSQAEDDMVAMYFHATFNLNPRASSIDTPLHSFIPGKHVDHMHPNAIISVAASRRCKELTKEIFGDEMDYVPWIRPGFELGLAMQDIVEEKSGRACDHDGPAWLHLVAGRRQALLRRDAAVY